MQTTLEGVVGEERGTRFRKVLRPERTLGLLVVTFLMDLSACSGESDVRSAMEEDESSEAVDDDTAVAQPEGEGAVDEDEQDEPTPLDEVGPEAEADEQAPNESSDTDDQDSDDQEDDGEAPEVPIIDETGPVAVQFGDEREGESWTSWGTGTGGPARSPVLFANTLFFCSESSLLYLEVARGASANPDAEASVVPGIESCDSIALFGSRQIVVAERVSPVTRLTLLGFANGIEQPTFSEFTLEGGVELSAATVVFSSDDASLIVKNADDTLVVVSGEEQTVFPNVGPSPQAVERLDATQFAVGTGFSRVPLRFVECDGECRETGAADVYEDAVLDMARDWGGNLYVALESGSVVTVGSEERIVLETLDMPDGVTPTGVALAQGRCFRDLYVTGDNGVIYRRSLDF